MLSCQAQHKPWRDGPTIPLFRGRLFREPRDLSSAPTAKRRLFPVLFRSCVVSWSLRSGEPIVLEDGVKLTTLRDAIAHLGKAIPISGQDMPAVLKAAEMLTNAAEHNRRRSIAGLRVA
jgi:hypothetical protein